MMNGMSGIKYLFRPFRACEVLYFLRGTLSLADILRSFRASNLNIPLLYRGGLVLFQQVLKGRYMSAMGASHRKRSPLLPSPERAKYL